MPLQVCVFLLSLRVGSSGLTLTSANRVFLLEPSLDPAIEQQAVARVHRIGQEREVIITRLLVQGTIEEQVGLGMSGYHVLYSWCGLLPLIHVIGVGVCVESAGGAGLTPVTETCAAI